MQTTSFTHTPCFSSSLPVTVYTRPAKSKDDWSELDRGPGYFTIPPGEEAGVRIHNIDDQELGILVEELESCPAVAELNLSENRKITDAGVTLIKRLPQLTGLNLSSCNLTDAGLETLSTMSQLESLNLSYCNRITDVGIKRLRSLARLFTLDLQGCVKITNSGLSKIRRPGLAIHK